MTELPRILKCLMAEQHLTISELARRTGVAQPALHRISTGETENPKVCSLSPIAKYFNISISQLIGDEAIDFNRQKGTYNPNHSGYKKIPIINWEQVTHWPENNEPMLQEMMATDIPVSKKSFALRLKDTTMRPRFPEGTVIVIDPEVTPEDRDFALVQVDNQKPTFKQILIDGDNIYLKPLNSEFSMITLEKKPHFIGTMVQAKMDFTKEVPNNSVLEALS